mmetsp:Transcript_11504/g.25541  ORF Transcript_11504/g.25541 Transcript_11504/m.25541 type:complete len:99 (+) Transcript_11504:74-370(+)
MAPKKDAKKGAGKEIDHALYVRRPVELGDIPVDTSHIEKFVGHIANIDTIFPEWDGATEENWAEAAALQPITYPASLGVTGETNFQTFFLSRAQGGPS